MGQSGSIQIAMSIIVLSGISSGLQSCSATVNSPSHPFEGGEPGLGNGQNAKGTEATTLAHVDSTLPESASSFKDSKNDPVLARADSAAPSESTETKPQVESPQVGSDPKGNGSPSTTEMAKGGDPETALQPFVIAGSALGDPAEALAVYSLVALDQGPIRVVCNDGTVYRTEVNSSVLIQCWLAQWPENPESMNPTPLMVDPSRTAWHMRVASCPEAILEGSYGIHMTSLGSTTESLGPSGMLQGSKNPATQVLIQGDAVKACTTNHATLTFTLTDKISLQSKSYSAALIEFLDPMSTTTPTTVTSPAENTSATAEPGASPGQALAP